MELGPSLILIAIGAVLRFAVTASTKGINLHTVGIIVMIVGIVGFILSLMWMFSRRSSTSVVREDVVERPAAYQEVRYR